MAALWGRRTLRIFFRRTFSTHQSVFLFGCLIGIVLAVFVHSYQLHNLRIAASRAALSALSGVLKPYDFAYEHWIEHQGLHSIHSDPDVSRYNLTENDESEQVPSQGSEAQALSEKINVACVVFAESLEWAKAASSTWGRHCNTFHLFSAKFGNATVGVTFKSSSSSFQLFCEGLHQIYEEDDRFSWLLVVPERGFALLENLRYYVAPLNASEPRYLGHAMTFWGQKYNWQDAGYVLSKGATLKLLSKFPNTKACGNGGRFWKNGDWYLGKHLADLGIFPEDTRDHRGRGRFNGYSFNRLLFPGAISVFERYWRDSLYLSPDGPHCCSPLAISFYGVGSVSKMYQLEYILYHLRPFYGGGHIGNVPPKPDKRREGAFLTQEEWLKDQALQKLMAAGGLHEITTPKGMEDMIKHSGSGKE